MSNYYESQTYEKKYSRIGRNSKLIENSSYSKGISPQKHIRIYYSNNIDNNNSFSSYSTNKNTFSNTASKNVNDSHLTRIAVPRRTENQRIQKENNELRKSKHITNVIHRESQPNHPKNCSFYESTNISKKKKDFSPYSYSDKHLIEISKPKSKSKSKSKNIKKKMNFYDDSVDNIYKKAKSYSIYTEQKNNEEEKSKNNFISFTNYSSKKSKERISKVKNKNEGEYKRKNEKEDEDNQDKYKDEKYLDYYGSNNKDQRGNYERFDSRRIHSEKDKADEVYYYWPSNVYTNKFQIDVPKYKRHKSPMPGLLKNKLKSPNFISNIDINQGNDSDGDIKNDNYTDDKDSENLKEKEYSNEKKVYRSPKSKNVISPSKMNRKNEEKEDNNNVKKEKEETLNKKISMIKMKDLEKDSSTEMSDPERNKNYYSNTNKFNNYLNDDKYNTHTDFNKSGKKIYKKYDIEKKEDDQKTEVYSIKKFGKSKKKQDIIISKDSNENYEEEEQGNNNIIITNDKEDNDIYEYQEEEKPSSEYPKEEIYNKPKISKKTSTNSGSSKNPYRKVNNTKISSYNKEPSYQNDLERDSRKSKNNASISDDFGSETDYRGLRKRTFDPRNKKHSKLTKDSKNAKIEKFDGNYIKKCKSLTQAGKDFGGKKKTNQDFALVERNLNGILNYNIFGVLDGHGPDGHFASQFVSRYLISKFKNHYKLKYLEEPIDIYHKLKENSYKIINDIFLDTNDQIAKENFDASFSGTTCVIVIQLEEHLICANVGDSRAILVYDNDYDDDKLKKSFVFPLSYDCKPDLQNEKKRIIQWGGEVHQSLDEKGVGIGPYRVWQKGTNYPGLAMSRSIGDLVSKKLGVIPDPLVVEKTIDYNCKFVVICSDGVWEFLKNQDVMEIGKKFYLRNDPEGLCHELIRKSTEFWEEEDVYVDDITAVVLFF